MKKIQWCTLLLAFTNIYADFDFGECTGSGTFEQQIHKFQNYEDAATVGEIPEGIEGLHIELISDKDVDIRLYGTNKDKIVHWPHGIHNQSTLATKPYKNVNVTYSGYNGVDGKKGHEFIDIVDTTSTTMIMKAFGYQAGFATVNYSWTGKEGCVAKTSGEGNFTQVLQQNTTSFIGTIPPNVNDVQINLASEKDLDIQLYGKDGTAIASWKPTGLMDGSTKQSIVYHDMNITWSGYNGTNGQKGHEYIKITGLTSEMLVMKVYGYEAGEANVEYSWGSTIKGTMGSVGLDKPDSIFPKMGNGGYDVQHYNIALVWDKESKKIAATATITAKATQKLSGFYLDFYGLTIDTLKVNGANVTYTREGNDLKIILPQSMVLKENSTFTCVVSYHGEPDATVGGYGKGWTNTDNGSVVVVSEPNGAMNWFPCNNHPRDKASYSLEITVPKPYIVASNGEQINIAETANMRTYSFKEDDPMMTYAVTVSIAEFEVHSDIGEITRLPIKNYIETSLLDKDLTPLDAQDEMINFFNYAVGDYPFDEVGAIVISAPYSLALETQSFILYLNAFFPVAHEIAHQWFGDSLSIEDWKDIWLNEGFSTYMDEILWKEDSTGKISWLRGKKKPSSPQEAPGNVISEKELFRYRYTEGARVLVEIENKVGKDVMLKILKEYVSRYRDKTVSTKKFKAVAEEVSGQDLSQLFLDWLYGGKKL